MSAMPAMTQRFSSTRQRKIRVVFPCAQVLQQKAALFALLQTRHRLPVPVFTHWMVWMITCLDDQAMGENAFGAQLGQYLDEHGYDFQNDVGTFADLVTTLYELYVSLWPLRTLFRDNLPPGVIIHAIQPAGWVGSDLLVEASVLEPCP